MKPFHLKILRNYQIHSYKENTFASDAIWEQVYAILHYYRNEYLRLLSVEITSF